MFLHLREYIRRFGPGMIWAVAAIGSGELIIASKIGAEYGLMFVWALWIGIWLKYWIQKGLLDITVLTGIPIVEVWHRQTFGTYSSLYWGLFFLLTATGVAGLIGLCASLLTALFPVLHPILSACIITAVIIAITIRGSYKTFEKSMLLLTLILVVGTIATLVFSTPPTHILIDWGLPTTGVTTLIFLSLLGWGAGSGPDLMLPYSWWVSEKQTQTPAWKNYATHDLIWGYAMAGLVATIFMVAGTAVLRPLGIIPEGADVLLSMSAIFTHSFGEWSFFFFIIPAFIAIFSTALGVFDGGRIALVHLLRLVLNKDTIHPTEYRSHRWYQIGLVCFSLVPLCIFIGVPRPVFLVLIAGAISAVSMPLLALQVYLSLRQHASQMTFHWFYRTNLILGVIVYTAFTAQAIWELL